MLASLVLSGLLFALLLADGQAGPLPQSARAGGLAVLLVSNVWLVGRYLTRGPPPPAPPGPDPGGPFPRLAG